MNNSMEKNETIMNGSVAYRNLHVKCMLANGQIERHTFIGKLEDTNRFMENLEGTVMEIHILSFAASQNEETADASTKETKGSYRGGR